MAIKSNYPHQKINPAKALELRLVQGLSYREIGKRFGASPAAVKKALDKLGALINNPAITRAYRERKGDLLEAVELELVGDLLDGDRRRKASLNNTAYALSQINNMLRLERGQSTANTLSISAMIEGATRPKKLSGKPKEEGKEDQEVIDVPASSDG